jgi:hypothetical protein
MPVKVLFPGARYVVCAWLDADEEESEVERFIVELYGNNDSDAEALHYELEKASNHGPSRNTEKFRYLKGHGQDLVEFKARGGSRILAFVDPAHRKIVCTHGVPKLKKKRFDREVLKLEKLRNTYLIENMAEGSKYVN